MTAEFLYITLNPKAAEAAAEEAAKEAAKEAVWDAAEEAAKEAAERQPMRQSTSSHNVPDNPDRLLKTLQDVSRQDKSRKDKDFSRNVHKFHKMFNNFI